MNVLGVNAVFHDLAAALVVDGVTVAACEEERLSRRKHGKASVPFSTWELPVGAMRWCLEQGGLAPEDVDLVGYSYDPELAPSFDGDVVADAWEGLRTLYVERAPRFVATALPGLDPERVRFVAHHVAHAASACLAAPFDECAVLTVDGRGEQISQLAGHAVDGSLKVLATQQLPHSLGLTYEALTEHLGFARSSDEYKVMALASYGEPRWLEQLRRHIATDGEGGFATDEIDWSRFAPPGRPRDGLDQGHADLAASVQRRLEEALVELAAWLHERTGSAHLAMAGGVALNCVANSRLVAEGPFEQVWVQPAAGDAGTALGAALQLAAEHGERVEPMPTAALGRGWSREELETVLRSAALPYTEPDDLAAEVADIIAADGLVAWFQGRSEFGPRALGHRSLLANATRSDVVDRLNGVKGREPFRPVAPMVLGERAAEIFDGPLPSPYMLFTHRVRPEWIDAIPGVVHVDGTARIQTVDRDDEPLVARLLEEIDARLGVPLAVNTSLNTAGRPMVDSPRDALECFGSAPIDALALGPFLVRRSEMAEGS